MNELPRAPQPPLPNHLHEVCDRFEAAWQATLPGGLRPRLESFVAGASEPDLQPLLVKLVDREVGHRRRLGESPTPEEYLQRFPQLPVPLVQELILREGAGVPQATAATIHHKRPMSTSQLDGNDGQYDCGLGDLLAPPQHPDEIGTLGTYRVLKLLGYGGMGVVFQAEDPALERLVALKTLLPALAVSTEARNRFVREAKAAAAIKHPHVVTIFQVGEDRDVPFLAMEFLEGETLNDRLNREIALPAAEAARIGREMAEGLAAAHKVGLIHRDIKPANTWLEGKQGHVKLLDFGLARSTGEQTQLTQNGALIGTPAYMAPEQGNGVPLDARCDLWSLGVVLYRMCTGELPFKGTSTLSVLKAVALHDPPPPAQRNASIPVALSDLIMELLEKVPAKRTASARRVVEVLREVEASLAQRSNALDRRNNAPTLPATANHRHRSRKPVVLTLAGCLAAAVIVGAVLLWWVAEDTVPSQGGDPKSSAASLVQEDTAPHPGRVPKEKATSKRPADGAVPGMPVAVGNRTVLLLQRFQHAGPVASVAVSGDGKHVLTGSWDNTANLWESATGARLQTFHAHQAGVTSVALSSDGKHVLSGSFDKTAILWEAVSGKPLQTAHRHTLGIWSVALSGDGKHLLTGSADKTAILWEAASGKPLQTFQAHTGGVLSVSLSSDSKQVLTGSADKTAILWEAASGKSLQTFQGHTGDVTSVALSRNGKHVLTGAWDWPRGAILWETATGQPLQVFQGHATGVTSVALSHDATLVLTGSADKTAILWEAASGKVLQTLREHTDRIISVALSGDGRYLVTGSDDKTAILWEAKVAQAP
jgi:serine/threonine protein kinase